MNVCGLLAFVFGAIRCWILPWQTIIAITVGVLLELEIVLAKISETIVTIARRLEEGLRPTGLTRVPK